MTWHFFPDPAAILILMNIWDAGGGGANMTVLSLKRSTTCAVNVRIRSESKRPVNGDSVRSKRALKAGRPSVFIKLHVQGRCILII